MADGNTAIFSKYIGQVHETEGGSMIPKEENGTIVLYATRDDGAEQKFTDLVEMVEWLRQT